jgi:hypothetical protein
MPEADKKENQPSLLEKVNPGQWLRLRDGAMAHVRKREWVFKGIEKDGSILLMRETEAYGLVVQEDDIGLERTGPPSHLHNLAKFLGVERSSSADNTVIPSPSE